MRSSSDLSPSEYKKEKSSLAVVHDMHISCHMCMVHTVHVYPYGITICIWYGLLYHKCMVNMHGKMYISILCTLHAWV